MSTKLDNLSDEARDELASLSLRLSRGKTRKNFLGMVKEVAPETPIPEIDTENSFRAELEKRDRQIEELNTNFNNYKTTVELTGIKKNVKDKYQLSDDDMGKVEKLMTDRHVLNYEDAAKLYDMERAPAEVTYSGGFGKPELPMFDGIMEDEQNWSVRTAHNIIDEMQKNANRSRF